MGRFSASNHSYSQHIERFSPDHFRLSWVVDFYYPTSRLRHPRRFSRDTDQAGAARFAKKWRVAMPPPTEAKPAKDRCS